MRFNKKLLAALLPIAATGALVPALSSCNKGNGWTINYGDSINCYNTKPAKDETPYHHVNDVKNAVNSHVSIETLPIIEKEQLPAWGTTLANQFMYYDLIASHAMIEKQIPFELTCTLQADKTYKFSFIAEDVEVTEEKSMSYTYKTESSKNVIYINIGSHSIKSYCFQNTVVKGA